MWNIIKSTYLHITAEMNSHGVPSSSTNVWSIKNMKHCDIRHTSGIWERVLIFHSPMNPAGKVASVRTLPSTLTNLCMRIFLTSVPFRAYFSRFLRKMTSGSDSRSLWGPQLGRGAKGPPSFPSIHALGALRRFRCFFGPLAWKTTIIVNIVVGQRTRKRYKLSIKVGYDTW